MFSLRYLKVWVGGAILLLLCVCGVAAPLLAPRDPQAQTLATCSVELFMDHAYL